MALRDGSFVRSLSGSVDDRRHVTFFKEAVYNEQASMVAGRPIYREEERIEIAFPGNQLNIWHGRVTDEHRYQYPKEYEAFQKGEELAAEGTPIEQMTVLNKAQVKELKHFNVFTIEDAASLTDHAIQTMGMGAHRLREMAKKYLEQANGFAPVAQLVAKNEDLEGQLAAQKLTLEEMNRAIVSLQSQLQTYAQAPLPPQMQPVQMISAPTMPTEAMSSLDAIGDEPKRQKRAYSKRAA